jgi:hypothetical protein
LDDLQLRETRNAYCQQMDDFAYEAEKLYRVYEKIHTAQKLEQPFKDYEDVASEILKTAKRINPKSAGPNDLPRAENWDEITFIRPEKADIEKLNETFLDKRQHLFKQFRIIRENIAKLYDTDNPPERVIMEQRLDFLEDKSNTFNQDYNPFQVYPGLFIEVSLASINRRDQTLSKMGNVLTQFLNEILKESPDFAYEEYHQKKSSLAKSTAEFSSTYG